MTFWNEKLGKIPDITKGAHTVFVRCNRRNHYTVYNDGKNPCGRDILTFYELINGKGNSKRNRILICAYKVSL